MIPRLDLHTWDHGPTSIGRCIVSCARESRQIVDVPHHVAVVSQEDLQALAAALGHRAFGGEDLSFEIGDLDVHAVEEEEGHLLEATDAPFAGSGGCGLGIF